MCKKTFKDTLDKHGLSVVDFFGSFGWVGCVEFFRSKRFNYGLCSQRNNRKFAS